MSCQIKDTETIRHKNSKRHPSLGTFFSNRSVLRPLRPQRTPTAIVRRFIPKGADISKCTRKQIRHIEDWINVLPRKIRDGLSAEEKVKLHFKEHAA
jgi:hypothetical protein